jgi:hypothetical protein
VIILEHLCPPLSQETLLRCGKRGAKDLRMILNEKAKKILRITILESFSEKATGDQRDCSYTT